MLHSKFIINYGQILVQVTAVLLHITTILSTSYCKIITNHDKKIFQITATLLEIATVGYYKLRQLCYKLRQKFNTNYCKKLLQITAALIFYFCKIQNYYKLRQVLLQITATFTVIIYYGKFYYKLRQVLQIAMLLQITS